MIFSKPPNKLSIWNANTQSYEYRKILKNCSRYSPIREFALRNFLILRRGW